MIESLLVAVTRISTRSGDKRLTNATGFFFERDGRLFLMTSRHVVVDEASQHRPDRLDIEFHTNKELLAEVAPLCVPLYAGETALWRQAVDSAGMVDVAAVEIPRSALPEKSFHAAFTPAHVVTDFSRIEVGTAVLIVGFPLGFHDEVHHLPIARQAVIASAFGIRFQGHGYFVTDGLLHRGASGAPVVARMTAPGSSSGDLPWMLLGIHASRLDAQRDVVEDERLNLNSAWYADVLLTLTEDVPAPTSQGAAG